MEEVLKKGQDKKYDFSNKESQKLFEEFTLLLTDITKYVENQDEEKISIEAKYVKTEEELKQVEEKYTKTEEELRQVEEKYTKTEEELRQVEGKYVKTEEELRQVQNKEAELIARLELVSSGRYMVKAIFKESINLVYRILSFIPKKLINKFKNSSK